jgi:hypothetical protein
MVCPALISVVRSRLDTPDRVVVVGRAGAILVVAVPEAAPRASRYSVSS